MDKNRKAFMSSNIVFLKNSVYNFVIIDKQNTSYQIKYDKNFANKIIFENNNFYILNKL